MSETEKCSWCGVTAVFAGDRFVEFGCGSWRERNGSTWTRGDECTSPPPPIPPPPPPIPRPPQPVPSIETETVKRLVDRCEANEVSFTNADMSEALMFAQQCEAETDRLRKRLELSPASDRQELIRRFAVAIVGGYFAHPNSQMKWPDVWKYATELADAEPRVDGTEGQ